MSTTTLLYIIILLIPVIIVVQFVLMIVILKRLNKIEKKLYKKLLTRTNVAASTPNSTKSGREDTTTPIPQEPIDKLPAPIAPTPQKPIPSTPTPTPTLQIPAARRSILGTSKFRLPGTRTNREKVIQAIRKIKEVEEKDIPSVMNELNSYFSKHQNSDYSHDIKSKDYYRFIDLRSQPDKRIVVIGDIHSDFHSLSALLLKLSVSEYDYYEKGMFVFLGDYLDRGTCLFEPLLLLKELSEILGERLIILKGNHETIKYDNNTNEIQTRVTPNQSTQCLNLYCNKNKGFLKNFADFYSSLPIYVYVKTRERNILLTHAAIPRDIWMDSFRFDEKNGAIVLIGSAMNPLETRNGILKDMIWGDPKDCEEKIQSGGRFEFGRKQYNRFKSKNNIGILIRSHEEASNGYRSFYNDSLFTVFSTGGKENAQTDYHAVEPAFSVIQQNGQLFFENSYLYKVQNNGTYTFINPFSGKTYSEEQVTAFHFENEFVCDTELKEELTIFFLKEKEVFPSDTATADN